MSTMSFAPGISRPSAAPAVRLRLTRRGRVVLGLLIVVAFALPLLGLLRFMEGTASAGTGGSGQQALTTVVVKPGQTMWQLAESVDPAGDPRDMILRIEQINGMSDTSLVAGQSLLVPAA